MNGPCLGCQDRVLGCHSKCERYLEYRRKKDEIAERREADKIGVTAAIESIRRKYRH